MSRYTKCCGNDIIISCLIIMLIKLIDHAVHSNCTTGGVRLVGSEEGDEGRLEVCVNGAWGTVCREEFDSFEAAVACHSLGGFNGSGNFYVYYTIIFQAKECQTFCFFPQPQFTDGALLNLFYFVHDLASQILTSGYTVGDGPIFLSQLLCSGSEQSLLECSSGYPVGLHRCDHSMDVGLLCLGIC